MGLAQLANLANQLASCWLYAEDKLAFDPKKVASFVHVSGHVVCKRWWCSDKALGVTNLDAI